MLLIYKLTIFRVTTSTNQLLTLGYAC